MVRVDVVCPRISELRLASFATLFFPSRRKTAFLADFTHHLFFSWYPPSTRNIPPVNKSPQKTWIFWIKTMQENIISIGVSTCIVLLVF